MTLHGASYTCQKIKLFAGLGETCEGFDESTGSTFPSCEKGLECRDSGRFTIKGAEKICVDPICPPYQFYDKTIC